MRDIFWINTTDALSVQLQEEWVVNMKCLHCYKRKGKIKFHASQDVIKYKNISKGIGLNELFLSGNGAKGLAGCIKFSRLLLGMSFISCHCCWTWSGFGPKVYGLAGTTEHSGSPQKASYFSSKRSRGRPIRTRPVKQLETLDFLLLIFLNGVIQSIESFGLRILGLQAGMLGLNESHLGIKGHFFPSVWVYTHITWT